MLADTAHEPALLARSEDPILDTGFLAARNNQNLGIQLSRSQGDE